MIGVGDEVVCINDDEPPQSAPPYVIKGRTYKVARIERKLWPIGQVGPITIVQEMVMIWVEELPSETGHFAFRFRKVEKRSTETQVEELKKLLDTTKIPENIDG